MSPKKDPIKSTQHLQLLNKEANQITRESLETALIFLLEKKELAKISISELVQKAGVSRNAFYRNYHSKEQMLEGMFEQVVRRMFKELDQYQAKKGGQQAWLTLFQEAKKEARLLKLAFKYNFDKMLTSAVSEFLARDKADGAKKNSSTDSYANSFWSSAIVSMILKWVADGMKVSEEKMASLGLPLVQRKK